MILIFRMKKFIFSNIIVLILVVNPLLPKNNEYRLNKKFLSNSLKDSAKVFSSPREWKKKDLLKLGVITGLTCFLYKNDEKIQNWVISHKNQTTDDISKFIRNFGDGYYLIGLIGGIYLTGEISNEKSLRKTALLSLESLIISGIIVSGVKILTGRMRPGENNRANGFFPFRLESKYHSFPSGHSASAFAVATVIAEQSKNLAIDISAYSIACMVALSRVNDNFHWTSDVFFGSIIGYFVGRKISRINLQKESLNAYFTIENKKVSFILSYSF